MSNDGTDWASLRVRDGVGMDPGPVGDMLRAPDPRSGDEAYWRIEGTAFYSQELFEASEPLTQILVDAVCGGDGTPLGLMFATDMLVEITCGYTSPSEEEVGSAGLADRCRAIVRHRLPRLYRLVVLGPLSETRLAAQEKASRSLFGALSLTTGKMRTYPVGDNWNAEQTHPYNGWSSGSIWATLKVVLQVARQLRDAVRRIFLRTDRPAAVVTACTPGRLGGY